MQLLLTHRFPTIRFISPPAPNHLCGVTDQFPERVPAYVRLCRHQDVFLRTTSCHNDGRAVHPPESLLRPVAVDRIIRRVACLCVVLFLAAASAAAQSATSAEWQKLLEKIRLEFPTVAHIQPDALAQRLTVPDQPTPILIDVRSADEFDVSHIRGAINITSSGAFVKQFPEATTDQPIVVYCSVGYRSSALAETLTAAGYTRVQNLEGSLFAWANAGLPLSRFGATATHAHPYNDEWGRFLNREYRSDSAGGQRRKSDAGERLGYQKSLSFIVVLIALLSWETVRPFRRLFIDHLHDRTTHGLRNFALGALNAVVIAVLFVAAWYAASAWAAGHQFGILNWLPLNRWQHAVGAVILFDIFTYWFHRASHEIAFFWRFHRVHHSDTKMDVTTANRFHLGEIVLSSVLRIPALILFGAHLWELVLYELIMFPIVQFHHANIGLFARFDRFLRVLIVTPAMHKVHHSRIREETNSNYTSLLSVWDRLFGTFRIRKDPAAINFGLDEFVDAPHQSLGGMLRTPVVDTASKDKDTEDQPADE